MYICGGGEGNRTNYAIIIALTAVHDSRWIVKPLPAPCTAICCYVGYAEPLDHHQQGVPGENLRDPGHAGQAQLPYAPRRQGKDRENNRQCKDDILKHRYSAGNSGNGLPHRPAAISSPGQTGPTQGNKIMYKVYKVYSTKYCTVDDQSSVEAIIFSYK